MPKSRIQAVSFDVGGTLIAPSPSVGDIYARVAHERTGIEFDAGELNRRYLASWRSRVGFDYSRQAWETLVDDVFDQLVDHPPSQSFFEALYDEFARPESWRIFDDVIPVLEEIASAGIPMAVVSNWDERLRPLLKSLGLAGYFETMLVSCEVYFAKPSNVIFDHMVRNLGLPRESILHVGDSVIEDVDGATTSGLKGVLLDRVGTRDAGRITGLADILDMLNTDAVYGKTD